MEWKKIGSMEYGKIVFHSIPYHALVKCVSELSVNHSNQRNIVIFHNSEPIFSLKLKRNPNFVCAFKGNAMGVRTN